LSAPQPLHHDYEVFVQILDETRATIGNVTTHPGWGRHPTQLWVPGAIYADSYGVQVRKRIDSQSPLLAFIYTGFVDSQEEDLPPLTAFDGAGNQITPFVAETVLLPWSKPDVAALELSPMQVQFGETIGLVGFHNAQSVAAGEALTVTLLWEAKASPGVDYTAFVHVLDNKGTWMAGYDQAPGGTRFPTRVWAAGDQALSKMVVQLPQDLPPGEYSTWIGLYDAASAGVSRLPLFETDGRTTANAMIKLGRITVFPLPKPPR
jgi:hypothetical protein